MQDMVPLGTGNSRYLKSAISSTATWEQVRDMLRAGTFPIDFNGINSAGVSQQGTPLNKANLLTDATAALFGLTSSAVPNSVFAKIPGLISEKARVLAGRYVGTGTYGASNPSSITAPGVIKFAMFVAWGSIGNVWNNFNDLNNARFMLTDNMLTTSYTEYAGFCSYYRDTGYSYGKKSSDGKQFSWYNTSSSSSQFNQSNNEYYYMVIYE